MPLPPGMLRSRTITSQRCIVHELADLLHGRGLSPDEDVGGLGEDLAQAAPHHRVIVGDENLDHRAAPGCDPGNAQRDESAARHGRTDGYEAAEAMRALADPEQPERLAALRRLLA